jgi:transposase-like protein
MRPAAKRSQSSLPDRSKMKTGEEERLVRKLRHANVSRTVYPAMKKTSQIKTE